MEVISLILIQSYTGNCFQRCLGDTWCRLQQPQQQQQWQQQQQQQQQLQKVITIVKCRHLGAWFQMKNPRPHWLATLKRPRLHSRALPLVTPCPRPTMGRTIYAYHGIYVVSVSATVVARALIAHCLPSEATRIESLLTVASVE